MKKRYIFILFALILISACSGRQDYTDTAYLIATDRPYPVLTDTADEEPTGVPAAAYWPTKAWRTSSPEEQGMDSGMLVEMLETIDQRKLGIDSVLVVRNGTIVEEKYYPPYTENTRHELYSCTKSFISALVGIAIDDGYIEDVDQPVLDFFPEYIFGRLNEQKESMILEDLLTMRSGLDWDEGMPIYQEMMATRDWVKYVLDKPMAYEPGTRFNYCSGCSHILSAIIQQTTGVNTLEYAQSRLFDPLNISNIQWELSGNGIPNGGWGLEITPRDMAKFGYLYLNQGYWDGQQIVPSEWVRVSTQEGIATGEGVDYAYQWWVYSTPNLYAAQGLRGQKIYVIPDLELVIVFTADMENTAPIFELVVDWIIPAVRQVE